jgi:hydrogenase nickel incorporation protein HypB
MCEECGCSEPMGEHGHPASRENATAGLHEHSHSHGGAHTHAHKTIELGTSVMARNDTFAAQNRAFFAAKGVYAVNLISSPGAGKTTLVEALARRFGQRMAVIEGDIQTSRDAERVIRAGSRAHQIQTGGACHLDAHSVAHAAEHLDLDQVKLLVIENVGNLVCPSTYDLGEHEKIAILSTPEGDDKVLKYPALFHRIGVLLINKVDLAPHLDFDTKKAVNECRSLNRSFEWFGVSAKTGEGMEPVFEYLSRKAEM